MSGSIKRSTAGIALCWASQTLQSNYINSTWRINQLPRKQVWHSLWSSVMLLCALSTLKWDVMNELGQMSKLYDLDVRAKVRTLICTLCLTLTKKFNETNRSNLASHLLWKQTKAGVGLQKPFFFCSNKLTTVRALCLKTNSTQYGEKNHSCVVKELLI